MKLLTFRLTTVLVLALQLASCGDFLRSRYVLELPRPPEPWVSLLGEPYWRLEWLDSGGKEQMADIPPGKSMEIELPITWTNPVTASPFWPGHNLIPGLFKPAGALFPFDVYGERLCLSWKAGPDAVFYRELVLANGQDSRKIPANFDWPRFRELFNSDKLNEAVRSDPWLVDWHLVAEKTISSNFDQRRLVPEAAESINISVPAGPWYGVSSFTEPLYFTEGINPVFPVRPGINVWISSEGILRINGKTWILAGFPKE